MDHQCLPWTVNTAQPPEWTQKAAGHFPSGWDSSSTSIHPIFPGREACLIQRSLTARLTTLGLYGQQSRSTGSSYLTAIVSSIANIKK